MFKGYPSVFTSAVAIALLLWYCSNRDVFNRLFSKNESLAFGLTPGPPFTSEEIMTLDLLV